MTQEQDVSEYGISRFTEDHLEGYLELHNSVFDSWGKDAEEQFTWKYRDNPFLDHVPVIVATIDDKVVGGKGCLPLSLRIDGSEVLAIQTSDSIVHPEHRRQGIFSQMYDEALARYGNGKANVFFSFAAPAPRNAYLERGWVDIEITEYSKPTEGSIHSPADLTDPSEYVSSALKTVYTGGTGILEAVDRKRSKSPETIDRIRTFTDPPIDDLVELYARAVPREAHVTRSAKFYEWRLAEPIVDFTTHIAYDGRDPIVGVITSVNDDTLIIRDVVPLVDSQYESTVMANVLHFVLDNTCDLSRVMYWGNILSERLLMKNGFVPAGKIPKLSVQNQMLAKSTSRTIDLGTNRVDVENEDHWKMSLIARDY